MVYYSKQNRYSFNALIGALEKIPFFNDLDIYFIESELNLFKKLKVISTNHEKVLVGISFFSTQIWDTHKLIKALQKSFGDEIIYLAGGPHPTGDPRGTLNMGFDIVVIGEGEETIIELFQRLHNDEDYEKIKGLAYRNDNDEYIFTGKRSPVNLDDYAPFPWKQDKFGAIEITRGCPYLCYFCQTPHILGTHPRHRSIESVVKYVRMMKEKNLTDVRFISPNAFSYGSKDGKKLNLAKLEQLLQAIKKTIAPRGRIFLGSFPSEVRPEHVNVDTLELIKNYCDNDNIIIGAQSGSQKMLNLCHREHTIADIHEAVRLTLEHGLKANVDMIFGLPGESKNDIKLTIKLMKTLTQMGARIHTHSFLPLPQTPFAKKNVKKIDHAVKKEIEKLTSAGHAFGAWKKQERLAKKLSKYLITRKL